MSLLPAIIASWLSPIEDPLEDGLIWIHESTGLSWAWSIIALTAVVRVVIMPLTIKQTRSMLAMQRLQPYIKQLQQKYKDDRQELNQRLMEFYKVNRVNPLASCLPILVQIPVFIALFFVLKDFRPPAGTSTDMSFLFSFISNDACVGSKCGILAPIGKAGWQGWSMILFYVASQIFASRVMMTTQDPRQKMLFTLLPVFFVPFILPFAIGVMLYWITTNLWTLAQHVVVVRLTTPIEEVHMPDDKGGEKTIIPKAVKAERRRQGKASGGSTPKSPSGAQRPATSAGARRNKRRR